LESTNLIELVSSRFDPFFEREIVAQEDQFNKRVKRMIDVEAKGDGLFPPKTQTVLTIEGWCQVFCWLKAPVAGVGSG